MVLIMATEPEDSLPFLLPLTTLLPSLLAVVALGAIILLWLSSPSGPAWALYRSRRPPSGPPGVVTALSSPVGHRTLAALSRAIDGRKALMSSSVGLTRLVVASEPDTAREILANPAFGDRPVKEAMRYLLFHRSMGFASSSDEHWRGLRRLAASHLFSPRRVAAYAHHRASIGAAMVTNVATSMAGQGEVSMHRILHNAWLNHIMTTVFSKHYDDFTSKEGALLEEMVAEAYILLEAFNWADYVPLLKWFDPQGVRRRCNRLIQKVDVFVGDIIQEHKARRADGFIPDELTRDFVDVLLDLEGEERLSDSDMIALLWEMIFAGADTVAILIEWVMARMVLHPDIQAKAQAELDAVVGQARAVEDADVANLPYIQSIVKETLRMHPPGPLLSARLAIHDAHVGGHLVPAGTTAMVNMWSIAHDAAIWPDPEKFRPERFLEEDVSVLGSDLRLAPFGAGRRVCPGKELALATTNLWVAQLLHKFEWAPTAGGVDLSERLGMSLEMAKPLVCKAAPRGCCELY